MSIASKITSMTEHIGDIYDAVELTGIDTTGVNKNLVNVPTQLKEAYVDIINNGTDELYSNFPKVAQTGEEPTLNGVYEAPMRVDLNGNTEQTILPSGYTQVDYIESSGSQYIDTGYIIKGVPTIETEIYITENTNQDLFGMDNRNNNVLILNYDANFYCRYGIYTSSTISGIQLNKWIKISYSKNVYVDDVLKLTFSDYTFSTNTTSFKIGKARASFYSTTRYKYLKLYDNNVLVRDLIPCYRNSDSAVGLYDLVNNVFYTNQGTGAFTYGALAPTPDVPVDIRVVKGDNTIKATGKNLFNKNNIVDGYVNNDGGITSLSGYKTTGDYIEIKPNTQYYKNISGSTRWKYFDENKNVYSNNNYDLDNATREQIFTTPANVKYLKFTLSDNNVDNFILAEGSTATSYQPYQEQTYPLNLGNIELCKIGDYKDEIRKSTGKNLFDKDNANMLLDDVSINGTTGVIADAEGFYTLKISCKPNTTYTISKVISSRFIVCYTNNATYTSGETFVEKVLNNSATNLTITTGENAKSLYVFYSKLSEETTYSLQQILDSIQIEENPTATDYEPFGKVWYLKKNIGKVVLDGSEDWQVILNVDNSNLFRIDFTGYEKNQIIYCNYYKGLANQNNRQNFNIYLRNDSNPKLDILDNRFTTVEDFKTWLSNNPVTVYYPLSTPTTEILPEIALITELEDLKTAKSVEGQTNITQTNEELPFIINASALSKN